VKFASFGYFRLLLTEDMRRYLLVSLAAILLCVFTNVARTETLQLTDGTSVTGELVLPATVEGLNIRIASGNYQRVSWEKFTQEALEELAKNPKLSEFVEPFIDKPDETRTKKTEITVKPVKRIERQPDRSLLGAMFSTGLGFFALAVFYVAGLYVAYEIAIVRVKPPILVCGVSAILPVIGQIIFLCLPVKTAPTEQNEEGSHSAHSPHGQSGTPATPATQPVRQAGGLQIASHAVDDGGETEIPETQVFQRGKFMFNRRFFETKFAGFFGVVRRASEKDMILIIKSSRGLHVTDRITRISANEMHLDVRKGNASQEISVPFSEVQEVQLKHKDAPET
jgi:hypothetical protein